MIYCCLDTENDNDMMYIVIMQEGTKDIYNFFEYSIDSLSVIKLFV